MRINENDTKFHKSCKRGGKCCPLYAHLGKAELAEYQQVVTHQIDQKRYAARNHGRDGLARLAQR